MTAYEIDAVPTPDHATTPGEFPVWLRQLKEWTGLTCRELEIRAGDNGDHLARSTLASTLRRDAPPRQEVEDRLALSPSRAPFGGHRWPVRSRNHFGGSYSGSSLGKGRRAQEE